MKKFDFPLQSSEPLYLQVYTMLVGHMKEGFIKKGEKLPSVRVLASQLNLSKSTIENAYDRLLSEGYIISKAKSGYYCDIPDVKKEKKEIVIKNEISLSKNYKYDFSSRLADYEQFDQKVWIKYTKEVLEDDVLMAGYGHPQGEVFLRQELSNYLYQSRNVHCKSDQLLIGAGIAPLLYFICSLFRNRQLTIAFLKPGFNQAIHVFEDCHHQVVLLDSLSDLTNVQVDFLYLTPSSLHLSTKQRIALLHYLKGHHIYLIEDDLNGEMFYKSTPLPSMQSLYDEDYVFYLSSFSKLLLPSVRIACLSIPSTFHYSLDYYNQTASRIEQQVFAMYLQDGHMARRVKRLKRNSLKKSQYLEEKLKKHFKDVCLVEPNLCFEIHGDFKHMTADSLINFQKLNDHTIRLYFSGMNESLIEEGIIYFIKKWKQS